MTTDNRVHAKISPSKLDAFKECPVFLSAPSENDAAKEGEMLHSILQHLIERYCKDPTLDFDELKKNFIYESQSITAEQINSLEVCIKEFQELLTTRAEEVFTEEKLEVLDPAGSLVTYGHVDLIVIASGNPSGKTAYIFDWKFGRNLVKPASVNLQGFAYAVAILQKRPELTGVSINFIQPRALEVSSAYFARNQLQNLVDLVFATVDTANAAKRVFDKSGFDGLRGMLQPNTNNYCRYCAHAGECPALLKSASSAVAEYHNLPALREIASGELTQPEKMAAALFIIKKLEPVIDAVKAAALEMAKKGFELEAEVDGRKIKYELRTRSGSRSINSLPGAYDVIKDIVPQEVVLSCATVKIGELEDKYVEFRVQKAQKDGEPSPTGKKKFTKKDAVEEFNRLLREQELINGDGIEIPYLKEVVVEFTSKETETKNQKTINI